MRTRKLNNKIQEINHYQNQEFLFHGSKVKNLQELKPQQFSDSNSSLVQEGVPHLLALLP